MRRSQRSYDLTSRPKFTQCDRSAFIEAPASYDYKEYGQNSIDGCFTIGIYKYVCDINNKI